jgi:uncharacterized protein YycO
MTVEGPPVGAYVLTSTTTGLAVAAIRLGTRSHWNHAAIVIAPGLLIEAQPGGVRRWPLARYDDYCWDRAQAEALTPAQADAISRYARSRLGAPYNWPAIAVFALTTLGMRIGPLTRWADRRRAVICSELVVLAYRAAGIDLAPGRPAAEVPPAALGLLVDRGTVTALRREAP